MCGPARALDRDALMRWQFGVLSWMRRSADAARAHLQPIYDRWCRGEPRGALAVRMVIGNDGRKRSHSFHRILMRSAAQC